jgi:hypothetical protein
MLETWLHDEPDSEQSFHVSLYSNGKITITRIPARDGVNNTFTFDSAAELIAEFKSLYKQGDIDRLLQKLTTSRVTDFRLQKRRRSRVLKKSNRGR